MPLNCSYIDSTVASSLADGFNACPEDRIWYIFGLIREYANKGEYNFTYREKISQTIEDELKSRGFEVKHLEDTDVILISWLHTSRLRRGK